MTAPSITREEILATLGRLYDRGRLTDTERRALNEAISRLQVCQECEHNYDRRRHEGAQFHV